MAAVSATILCLLVAGVFAVPRLLGWNVYAVASGSMEPFYPVGSLVFSRSVPPEDIRAGDCITYSYGEDTVTHRVLSVDSQNRVFLTKGDANANEDSPVAFSRLVGKTEPFSLPYLGYFVIWLKSGSGLALLCLLGAGAALLTVGKLWNRKTERAVWNAHIRR